MSTRGRTLLIVGGVVVLVVFVSLGVSRRGEPAVEVKLSKVERRNLVSIVTASGQIEPVNSVDILSDIMGRIVYLPVKEGDYVRAGEIVVKLDTSEYAAAVEQAQAGVAAAQANVDQAKANLDQATSTFGRDSVVRATNAALISAQMYDQARTSREVAAANLEATRRQVDQASASLRNAEDQLEKTTIRTPLAGEVTNLAVKLGEVAVPGTFSRQTGLLMTVSDMSAIEARVDVDETDVVRVKLGDSAQVSIDAYPDTTFAGRVTKIALSSTTANTSTSGLQTAAQAVDFEVRVTLDRPPPGLRPDLSATANIITDTRKDALAVPIIALTVREPPPADTAAAKAKGAGGAGGAAKRGAGAPAAQYRTSGDTTAAHRAKEIEGVFVVDTLTHVAHFTPVKVGIAGDQYFEVLSGLKAGETVVSGSYQAIKDLRDGSRVKAAPGTRQASVAAGS